MAHLAYMPMSLCNHDLSVVCHCRLSLLSIIGVGVVIIVIIGVVVCVQLSQWQHCSQKLHILQIYVYMSLVYAHEILGQCDIYFWNGSHFSKILNVAFLSTWLSLETSYLAQLCIHTGTTYSAKIMHLQIIFFGSHACQRY